jgi:hypothetical protein
MTKVMITQKRLWEMSDSLIENVSMPEGYTRTSVALRIASTLKCND